MELFIINVFIILLVSTGSVVMAPLSFLILVILSSLPFSWSSWLETYQYCWSFQKISFWFNWYSILLYFFQFHLFLLLYYFFSSAYFGYNMLSFCSFLTVETYIINFRSFSISNVCFQYYKFLSKHCFYCIPQILVNFSLIFIYFKLKKIYVDTYSEPMCYLEVCCLIFKYFEIFQLSFCFWFVI